MRGQKRSFNSRRSDRQPVRLLAACRKPTGFRGTVDVLDLTAEGCRIERRGILLERRQRVTLRLEGLEALAGIVRWISGDSAGIEFTRPLHPSIVLHLQQKHPPAPAMLARL